MSDQWFYVQGGQSRGPVSRRELKERAESGDVTSTTLVWKEGMDDWTAAGKLGLTGGPPPVKPPLPPSVPAKASPAAPLPPPARYMTPPPRPGPPANQHTVIFMAAGIALVAGLAIGWLAHAMFVPAKVREVAVAWTPAGGGATTLKQAVESPRPSTQTSKPPASPPAAPTVTAPPPAPPAVASPPTETPVPSVTPATPMPEPPATSPSPSTTVVPPATSDPPAKPNPPAAPPATTPNTPPASSTSSTSQQRPTQTLYQEIDVQRAPKMGILGVVTAQEVRYQMLSELKVGDPDAEGVRTVGQSILDTRLVAADELSRAQFADSLAKLKGWQFSYTLAKDGEVLKMMAGPADAPVAGKIEPVGGKGFLVTSVMDEAGWKELAQISFYVPDEQASGNKRQVRQMVHDFGPLGSFVGETSFVRKGTQQGLLRIDYAHKLAYKGPGKDAPAGGLPFAVKGANLRPDVAGGSIFYDAKAKRVRQAEDRFSVKGEIATDIAGVQIEEQQLMTVKLTDVNPWTK